MEQVIHIFHGFLGSPQDFSSFEREDVIIHDLYEMKTLPVITPDDILIGYSMGGRIALEIADECDFQLKKIVLINSHPGLQDESARAEREIFEEKILKELSSRKKDDFMNWWNALPLFNADKPISVDENRFQKSKALFEKFRLSQQKFHLPKITLNRDKVLWLVGLSDEKYGEIASDMLLPLDIHVKALPGGHRLFQTPDELKKVLIEEGLL